MKSVGAARLVFGIILTAIGFLVGIVGLLGHYNGALIVGIIFLGVGVLLLILYGAANSRANEYNEQYLKPYEGKVLVTNCHFCHHTVQCYAEQFREHRNFPEGFVYCPVCKKPLSIKAFRVANEVRRKMPDYYEYDLDEVYYDDYDE